MTSGIPLPILDAIRPFRAPYLSVLSGHSDLKVWHADVQFEEFIPTDDLAKRWSDRAANVAETWQKRPLALGNDSGCIYSCGEVELVGRLRNSGLQAFWISEWAGFPHVPMWEPFCIKRNEFRSRAPELWQYEQDLRAFALQHGWDLGKAGGHPDVVCRTDDGPVYIEYKGPGDSIKPKQNQWAAAAIAREPSRLLYFAVRGHFRPGARSVSQQGIARGQEELVAAREIPLPTSPGASTRRKEPQRVAKSGLHRRKISDTLKRERGWECVSHVDGSVDVRRPSSVGLNSFVEQVRAAVQELGYTPTVRVTTDKDGKEWVRLHTVETLSQSGQGAHGP